MEVNPGTVNLEKLKQYKAVGVNRLSLGLQSARNEELQRLGRIHTYEDFLATWNFTEKAGFENRNIDLMSALPGQTMESWEDTLEKVIALEPEHISAYSLILERREWNVMKFQIMQEQDRNAGITWGTGTEWSILGLVQVHPLFSETEGFHI